MKAQITGIIVVILLCMWTVPVAASDIVIVVDAGHGGHDAGCVGTKAREKDITLDVSKRLAKKINENLPGVKAILTRDTDRFLTLQQRANIANQNNGDLFISIHVNSVDYKTPGRKNVHGASVYTLGPDKSQNNLNVAMRENSVMELEEDYTGTYKGFDPNSTESYIIFELNQNAHMRQSIDFATLTQNHLIKDAGRADKGVRQDGFWVLWATRMPAVLVELDFICNPGSETFLNSNQGRESCADALFNAVKEYFNK
ncbi:MAG: N-acetylmuramoyl-L-alanine amidase [Muribaculaceae bacterium]|nr:N-acetylmuramoyl-L-alanine amidase [Muribaculaceae bacterium]